MLFKEALYKELMKEDDKFMVNNPDKPDDDSTAIYKNGSYFWASNGLAVTLTKDILNMTGEIIPAEPKVLTAEDYYTKTYGSFTGSINFSRSGLITVFNIGKKNGRLERDLELRPVIEAAKNSISGGHLSELRDLLENIPPLNKED